MITQAFNKGVEDTLNHFKIAWANVVGNAAHAAPGLLQNFGAGARNFASGQAGHLGNLGQGLQSWLGGNAAGRGQAWNAAKGLLPSAGIAAGMGLGTSALLGNDDPQQLRR